MINGDRKAVLDAAGVLVGLWSGGYYSDTENAKPYENILEENVAEAQKKLDEYRRSKAAWIALDAILPGWRYVDASDYIPREKWSAFASNLPEEWVAWLIANNVSKEVAERLVKQAFRDK